MIIVVAATAAKVAAEELVVAPEAESETKQKKGYDLR